MGNVLKQHSFYIKHIYNNVILDHSINARLRKYESPEDVKHVHNNIEKESVDYLRQAVVEGYKSTSHRYYQIKAKLLGKDRLKYWDRNVSVKKSEILDRKFSYDEAVDIVLKGYSEFSQEFCGIAKKFVENGWIDVMPKPGKTSGAFLHQGSCDLHPYILLNFFGSLRDVSTLAHELGHGIHQMLAAPNGPLLAEIPLTLAETASLFGEKLIFESTLKNASSDLEKVDMLCSKLDDTMNSVIRQIAFFEFEREVHSERQKKELSAEDISSIWMKGQLESLGEYVEIEEEVTSHCWSYISHFFHSPFYLYSYAFGEIFVNSLYNRYVNLEDKRNFVNKYTCLLSNGGMKGYDVAASEFGLNVKSLAFWRDGMTAIEEQVNDLEALCRGLSLCHT
jgi:oligoendopeptidase F